eukprot:COSAG06_NODE_3439_length_5348_cov_4.151457_4_plen_57_part_00
MYAPWVVAVRLTNITDAPLCTRRIVPEQVDRGLWAPKEAATCCVPEMVFAPSEESK